MKSIKIKELQINPFQMLNKEWALVAAGTAENFNAMTISWGSMGVLWNKPTITIYVRPQRYTKEFIDNEEYFTVSFFKSNYKKALNTLGTKSGRDLDKIKEAGLTTTFTNSVIFNEAYLTFVCKKSYCQRMDPINFIDETVDATWYPQKDHHFTYHGEIVEVLVNE